MNLYLDIETSYEKDITVVGVYKGSTGTKQIISPSYCDSEILKLFDGVSRVYTYNGDSFDLPFIKNKLGIDIKCICESIDLKLFCWKKNLYGGLKKVEKKLGIIRKLKDIDGLEAMRLWQEYSNYGSSEALDRLLYYNKEDVENLVRVRRRLKK